MQRGCRQADGTTDARTGSSTKAEGARAGRGVETLEKEGSACAALAVMCDDERPRGSREVKPNTFQ